MQAVLKLSELPPRTPTVSRSAAASVRRGEAVWGGTASGARRVRVPADGVECRAEQRIVTRDGALTPAERELIGLLRLRLAPVRA